MRLHLTAISGACSLLAAMLIVGGCNREFTIGDKGSDAAPATAPAVTAAPNTPPVKPVYSLGLPSDETFAGAVLVELMNDFDAAVGYDALIVPLPFINPTSPVTIDKNGADAAAGACTATAVAGASPALALTLSGPYLNTFVDKSGQLKNTDLYPLFMRCIGTGVGVTPGPASETLDAYIARLKTQLGA
jgi:hypothetical protein